MPRIKEHKYLKKVTHHMGRKETVALSAVFTAKLELVFVLTQ